MSVQHATNELLTPAEVAGILYVDPKTVTRWAIAGKITAVRTPGGHRRFLRSEIEALRSNGDPHGPRAGGTSSGLSGPGHVARAEDLAVAAATIVAEAVATARQAQADMTAEDLTVVALAALRAADTAVAAAEVAREGRALAACLAAEAVASDAARTAVAVQQRADATASRVAEAASRAAELVAGASSPGNERKDALTALQLAAVVQAAAVETAADTAAAAGHVASAVAAAAVDVAFMVSAADRAIEHEVARTAATLQAVASGTARQMATDSNERASATALLAADTAAAVTSDATLDRAAPERELTAAPVSVLPPRHGSLR